VNTAAISQATFSVFLKLALLTSVSPFSHSLSLLSIQYPAQNPNAPEVFYRVIAKNGNGPPVFIDDLLETLKVPLLLLWGDKDPWIRPQVQDTGFQGGVSSCRVISMLQCIISLVQYYPPWDAAPGDVVQLHH
jgi:pimeloyl-ACP methyl ester carboxylesterase